MRYKTKLLWGLGAIIVLMTIVISFVFYLLNDLEQHMIDIVQNRYQYVKIIATIRSQTSNIDRGLNNLVFNERVKNIEADIEQIVNARIQATEALNALHAIIEIEDIQKLETRMEYLHELYGEYVSEVIELIKNGKRTEAKALMLNEVFQIRLELFRVIDDLKAIQENLMEKEFENASNDYALSLKLLTTTLIISLFIAIAITVWVIRSISASLKKVIQGISIVPSGVATHLPRIAIESNDEIGEIAKAYNDMAESLEIQTRQEQKYIQKIEEKNWIESNIVQLASLYQGIQDIETFARLFIQKITPIVEASYGVFYLLQDNEENGCFRKLASYADTPEAVGNDTIYVGQGLVGQAALDNRKMVLDTIPEDYIKISSGIGSAAPKSILILPVTFHDQVVAMIELASFKAFRTIHQELLDHLLASVGTIINRIENHRKVEQLLEESQILTEELQSQSEELQLQQEELKSINEQLEEQYKHLEQKSRELDVTSQYKTEFLANMSHELRTPLNSLLILSQMLIENKERTLTEKQLEYVKTIYSSGNELLQLINDILDLAKIESGKMTIYPEVMEIREIREYAGREFQPIAYRKGVKFTLQFAENLPDTIITDGKRVKQILRNLLSNAFKFTHQGEVTLEIRPFDKEEIDKVKDSGETQPMLAISVKDTGIGILEDKLQQIFEAFQQADGSTSREYGGTGLGLSISKELAFLLGGSIAVESEAGKGSTFTLYLRNYQNNSVERDIVESMGDISKPARLEAAVGQEPPTFIEGDNLLQGKKILIVDDDMRNVFALTAALESKGIQVVFAENGKEGIHYLNDHTDVDLVIMDIMMPEMDGYETMREIRNMQQFLTLPMIALTAKAMKNDREKCIEAGASDYISKPVHLDQLFSLLQVWLYH